jgi:DNA-directed RNA polymerase beta' subunit
MGYPVKNGISCEKMGYPLKKWDILWKNGMSCEKMGYPLKNGISCEKMGYSQKNFRNIQAL